MKGHHNYNSYPIAPAGCKVVIYDRHADQRTWANHDGTDGFFVLQAPNHYRNFICYIPSTGATRVSKTVEFFPTHCQLPYADTMDTI